ncbi:alpha/beta hydrolase [Streptomyces albulus]|nr:alpha/beta hydrolase [Streptomyces noursei]
MEATTCAYWHQRPHHRTPLGSPDAPPALLVASEHDPVTPSRARTDSARSCPARA